MNVKEAGKKGGLKRAEKLSKQKRSQIARMGGLARHKKVIKRKHKPPDYKNWSPVNFEHGDP